MDSSTEIVKEAGKRKHQHHHGHHRHHRHHRHHSEDRRDREASLDRVGAKEGQYDQSSGHEKHGSVRHKGYVSRSQRDEPRDGQTSDVEAGRLHKRPRRSRHNADPIDGTLHRNTRGHTPHGGEGDAEHRHSPSRRNDETSRSSQPLTRDSWMTAPSGLDFDYVHRQRKKKTPPPDDAPRHHISSRELNSEALRHLNQGNTNEDLDQTALPTTTYKFGDGGSQWRMTKLNGVYKIAEQSSRPVEEVAVERFGSLREFDEAREENIEMERRRVYGRGYALKEKPTGDLYKERIERGGEDRLEQDHGKTTDSDDSDGAPSGATLESRRIITPVDQTTLNRLRAQLMKAKLRKAPEAAKLEEEYDRAAEAFSRAGGNGSERAVVLDAAHSRMLAGTRGEVKPVETRRGKERGLVAANDDMSIEDMVREERRTRGVAGEEGLRMAEQIAKDGKFDDDLDYLDENAEKLARRNYKSEANLKTAAISKYTKMERILESCPLCHHEDRNPPHDLPLAPIVSLGTRVFLTLPTEPELTGADGGAVIAPIDHCTNLLECGDDEWEEIRNFMKSLTRLYHDQGRDVVFYENAATPQRHMHAALVAVPIPYELGDTAPAFFREAILSADEEWSQHKKIIDTGKRAREGLGKAAFRKSIAKEMPYFHVWFSLDGGLGHIVEDANRWPKGDLFAREVLGGMLDVDASIIKRQGRWMRNDSRVDDFRKRWRKFDWTRILTESKEPGP